MLICFGRVTKIKSFSIDLQRLTASFFYQFAPIRLHLFRLNNKITMSIVDYLLEAFGGNVTTLLTKVHEANNGQCSMDIWTDTLITLTERYLFTLSKAFHILAFYYFFFTSFFRLIKSIVARKMPLLISFGNRTIWLMLKMLRVARRYSQLSNS